MSSFSKVRLGATRARASELGHFELQIRDVLRHRPSQVVGDRRPVALLSAGEVRLEVSNVAGVGLREVAHVGHLFVDHLAPREPGRDEDGIRVGLAKDRVGGDVVEVPVRVDQVANRLVSLLPDLRDHPPGQRGEAAGIHDEDGLLADDRDDVAAREGAARLRGDEGDHAGPGFDGLELPLLREIGSRRGRRRHERDPEMPREIPVELVSASCGRPSSRKTGGRRRFVVDVEVQKHRRPPVGGGRPEFSPGTRPPASAISSRRDDGNRLVEIDRPGGAVDGEVGRRRGETSGMGYG